MTTRVPIWTAAILVLALGVHCSAEEQPTKLVLKVDQDSSGPFGGQKGASCLRLYTDGRLLYASRSTAAIGVEDEHGKVTHPERRDSREYRVPERDSWQVSAFIDFVKSKGLRGLEPYYPPPHPPTDFFETTSVQVILPDGKGKQVHTREYYVASLVEKTKYPSALIVLMDQVEQFEHAVAENGTPTEVPPDCKLDQKPEPALKKQ